MAHQQQGQWSSAWRVLAALIVALLGGSLLAACGSEDDDAAEAVVQHFDQSALSRGQQAPDFMLPEATGGTVSLSDYTSANQPVMLFFHMAGG